MNAGSDQPWAPWQREYQALRSRAGLCDFSQRTLIAVSGRDRATFLHNFCTHDIRSLAVGGGREAFVLNAQGKTLAHLHVFAEPDRLVLETVSGQASALMAHFDKYVIREDVHFADLSSERREWLIGGPHAADILHGATRGAVPLERLASSPGTLAGAPVWLRRFYLTGPHCFLIDCGTTDHAAVGRSLREAGATVVTSAPALEAARIEAGVPLFGQDISIHNLPQELDRDALAISFVKGCYLGQETVARIDALGHVNRMLRGVVFDAAPAATAAAAGLPTAGTPLLVADEHVGSVTSATYSPQLDRMLALAFVKRGQHAVGCAFTGPAGVARVVALPV